MATFRAVNVLFHTVIIIIIIIIIIKKVKELQKTAVLGTAHTLREVLM
jgi:hypothetical protein